MEANQYFINPPPCDAAPKPDIGRASTTQALGRTGTPVFSRVLVLY